MSTTKTSTKEYPFGWLCWLAIAILAMTAVVGNSYFSDVGGLYRALGLLGVAVVAFFLAINTSQGAAAWLVVKEAQTEIRKVEWPTKQETNQTTLIVIVLVLVTGVLIWGLDSLFRWLASLIIG